MRLIVGVLIGALWPVLASQATAQILTPNAPQAAIESRASSPMEQGQALTPIGSVYRGGYASSVDGVEYRVHLYEHRLGTETDPGPWVPLMMRVTARRGEAEAQWADGRVCPAVYGVHQMLADFPAGRFQQPRFWGQLPRGASTPPRPPIVVHGVGVTIWGWATQVDGGLGTMTITGQEGVLGDWARFAEEQLAPCWINRAPEF